MVIREKFVHQQRDMMTKQRAKMCPRVVRSDYKG